MRPAGLQQRHARARGGKAGGGGGRRPAPGLPGTDDDVVERPSIVSSARSRFASRADRPRPARLHAARRRASQSCAATTSAVSRHRPTDDGRHRRQHEVPVELEGFRYEGASARTVPHHRNVRMPRP
jgi:hypothetical protein